MKCHTSGPVHVNRIARRLTADGGWSEALPRWRCVRRSRSVHFRVRHLGVLAEDCLCGRALVSGYGGCCRRYGAPIGQYPEPDRLLNRLVPMTTLSGWLSVDRRALPLPFRHHRR